MPWEFWENVTWVPSWWDVLLVVTYLLVIFSVPSVLLQREGNPYSALSWILALFALPPVGLFFWWAFGRKHLSRKKRKRRRASRFVSQSLAQLRGELPAPPTGKFPLLPIRRLPQEDASWVFPATSGNRVGLLVDSKEFFPALERAIDEARDHLHVMFYIWHDDATGRRFRDILTEKARQGVTVRLLCDAFGSPSVGRRFMAPLCEAGGKVALFLPPRFFTRSPAFNFRNHRKLVVADGKIGFLAGMNIGDEYTKDWHDTAISIAGPALDQLQEVFVDDWFFATGEDIARARYFGRWSKHSGDNGPNGNRGPEGNGDDGQCADGAVADATCAVIASGPHTPQNSIHDAFFVGITQARKRVYITTPYFIPDAAIAAALRTAAYRGVDVRLVLPAKIDVPLVRLAARSYYSDLLQAGVRIYEYQPEVLHAKSTILDDDVSVIGSANIDLRSFKLNFEATCFVQSPSFARQLLAVFERDLAKSREVTLEEMQNRSYWNKLTEAAAHLLSPML